MDFLASQLGKHTVANIDLSLVGMIIALHVVLNFAAKLVYGDKRNTAAVMGGQGDGGDPKKQNLEKSQTSPISQIIAYNIIAVQRALRTGVTPWQCPAPVGHALCVRKSRHHTFRP